MTIRAMKISYFSSIFFGIFTLVLSVRCESQVPFTLSAVESSRIEEELNPLREAIEANDKVLDLNFVLQGINVNPPASLDAAIQREGQESFLAAMIRLWRSLKTSLYQEIRSSNSKLFISIEERVWAARQYAYTAGLVAVTDAKGENIPLILREAGPEISKAEFLRFIILAEIRSQIQNGDTLSEVEEKNRWIASSTSVDAYKRLCVLLTAKRSISKDSVYQEVLRSYRLESENLIIGLLIDNILSSGDLVFAKNLAGEILEADTELEESNRLRLQAIMEK